MIFRAEPDFRICFALTEIDLRAKKPIPVQAVVMV